MWVGGMQEISFEVRGFLRDNIQSVWQLDLLIALMNIKHPVDANTLARLLYSSPGAIEAALQKFVKSGFVKEIPGKTCTYFYSPALDEKRKVIEETAKTYAIRRVDVINLIFSNPSKHGIR